jgi:SNF2 family DNA or RNA helicase
VKTYGTIHKKRSKAWVNKTRDRADQGDVWIIVCEPHVAMRVKRWFQRASVSDESEIGRYELPIDFKRQSCIILKDTPEVCEDLRMILGRFPMVVEEQDYLLGSAHAYRQRIEELTQVLEGRILPRDFTLELPPRDYQRVAAELFIRQEWLLLADWLGLGKTCSAITAVSQAILRPALIVVPSHLPKQWRDEFARFLPLVNVEILRKQKDKPSGQHDVTIVPYSILSDLRPALITYGFQTVIFDECQELRRAESQKYAAAFAVSQSCRYRLGMSATPIYNYGEEIFNVIEVLQPGKLGTRDEFYREWCISGSMHHQVKDPSALGTYMRDNCMMLRRMPKDVGRELPKYLKIIHEIPADIAAYVKGTNQAEELAKKLLEGSFTEQGQAARELDMRLRQATGIAKGPAAAEFIRILMEDHEKLVVYAYHHAVYDILMERLKEFKPVRYSGQESPAEKEKAKQAFVNGDSGVLLISTRSGTGLDGLQNVCHVVVIVELDWSPQVIEQDIGRVDRDGQENQVTVYVLVTSVGSDPTIANILGIKKEQSEGIMDLGKAEGPLVETDGARVKQLAKDYLASLGKRITPQPETVV